MQPLRIPFGELRKIPLLDEPEKYQYNPNCKWPTLRDMVFKWMRLWGWIDRSKPEYMTMTDVSYITVEMDTLIETIIKYVDNVAAFYHGKYDAVIIGRDILMQVAREIDSLGPTHPMAWEVTNDNCSWRRHGAKGIKSLAGMKIIYLPYFEGVVPVNSEYLKEELP